MGYQSTAKRLFNTLIFAVGAGCLVWGVWADGRVDMTDARGLGVALFVAAAAHASVNRSRRDEEAIYEVGFSAGWNAAATEQRKQQVQVVQFTPRPVKASADRRTHDLVLRRSEVGVPHGRGDGAVPE